jgi:glucose-1-phosphate cytidylyltransferase
MKVVLLCGGLGTRIREETEFRPKPMVEVGGRPILWHIMKYFAHFGFCDFVLCLGYRGAMIKDYFLNYEAMNNDLTISLGHKNQIWFHGDHEERDFNVTLADTGLETLTGGRLKRVAKYLADSETFMLTYGDGLVDLDLCKLLEFHRTHGKLASVTAINPLSRFGLLQVTDGGQASRFVEKPATNDWVSAGYFVLNRKVIDYIDSDQTALEKEPLARLAEDGQLMAFRHHGFFHMMDTYREYQKLNEIWAGGEAPWKVWR